MISFPVHPRANVKEGYFERTNMEAPRRVENDSKVWSANSSTGGTQRLNLRPHPTLLN